VNIPAGVDDEMRIRVSGEGHAPEEGHGPAGDLYVQLSVMASNVFKRQGADVYVDAKVPFYTAILGGRVRVPTLDGDVELKVPVGTQPDDVALMRNRGIKKLNSNDTGNQYVKLKVEVPKYDLVCEVMCGRKLTDKQRKLVEQLVAEFDQGN
jgi:molecular chaperone DnaJ